jgi:hypothetical protein
MFELPWVALFVLFTPAWWFLVFVASCLIMWALDDDNFRWATAVIVCGVLVMSALGGVEWYTCLRENPRYLGYGVLGYFGLGTVWAMFKWVLFGYKERDKYEKVKRTWLKDHGIDGTVVPNNLKVAFTSYLVDEGKYIRWVKVFDEERKTWEKKAQISYIPVAWENKSRWCGWAAFWPWSLTWFIIADLVKRTFEFIQRRLGRLMDAIMRRIWRGVEDDFRLEDGSNAIDKMPSKQQMFDERFRR